MIALLLVGVCVLMLVRWGLRSAGFSDYFAINVSLVIAILYSISLYSVLRRVGEYLRQNGLETFARNSSEVAAVEELIHFDSPELIDAVRIWSGCGQYTWPFRDESRLRSKLGSAKAERLLPIIKKLQEDFYGSDANLKAIDLADMGTLAKTQFQQRHPNIPAEIASIFAWCYTFDNR